MELQEQRWASAMRAERSGDARAYAAFLEELADSLRRIIRYRLSHAGLSTSEAEDVVQETLIAVHTKRAQWDDSKLLLPWINAITRYKVIDTARRMRKEQRLQVHWDDEDWASLSGADEAADDALSKDVDQLVGALPTGQQAVVRAIGIEGASPKEAAERLEMSEGAVRVAFHRGLKQLTKVAQKLGL